LAQQTKPSNVAVWWRLTVVYLVWGSTYLGIALAIRSIPPLLMAGFRFSAAGLLLTLGVLATERSTLVRPSRRQLADAAAVGILLAAVGNGLVSWGEQTVPSGIAALLIALVPAWMAIWSRLAFGRRLTRRTALGIAVGLFGVAILAWPTRGLGGHPLNPAGLAALVVAPAGWALGSAYAAHRARLPGPALLASGLEMLAGGVVLVAVGLLVGEGRALHLTQIAAPSLIAFLYLVLVGSVLTYTVYGWLLGHAPISLVSTYAYVNPVVAVLLGAVVLGEPVSPRVLLAGATIVAAVALIVRSGSATLGTTGGPAAHERGAVAAGEALTPTGPDLSDDRPAPASSPQIASD
jgi:drug/metabolite transporter (DMT)-like permease